MGQIYFTQFHFIPFKGQSSDWEIDDTIFNQVKQSDFKAGSDDGTSAIGELHQTAWLLAATSYTESFLFLNSH